MYLFTRNRTADLAQAPDAMAFAVDIAQHVKKVTGVEVLTWSAVYGAPIGSISWSCRAESLAAIATMTDQLNGDADYLDKVQQDRSLFTGPLEDTVGEVVAISGTATPGRYTNVITAQCAPGRIGEAMAWAVEAQNASSKLTGLDGLVVRSLYGPFATVAWLTPLETIEQAQAADQAFKDPEFGKTIDAAGALFVTGNTQSRLIQRLA